jgi:DNA-binding NarL/FixJ family response regulator
MAASVLVVSNPEDRDAILAPLRKAGVSELLARDGSDDTLALCARARPEVVIVSARLEHGDARAFISALRELDPDWSPRVILIGELDGPLRTPLDVSDLHVDHFLVQPLSPKALVFSTRSSIAAATASRKPQQAETEARPSIDDSTEFVLFAAAPPEPAPAWRARTEILGSGTDDPAARRAALAADRSERGGPATDPGAEAEWQQSMEPAAASFVGPIVLSPVEQELTPLPEPVPFIDGEVDELADFDLQVEVDIGAELEADLARPAAPAASHATATTAEPQAPDRTFASELQRKMSAMEERLLAREARGPAATASAASDAAPADGPAHGMIRRGQGDFATLLERMYRERFTGRLLLQRRHAEKTVMFQHGRPVFAASNQAEDRLGALLTRAGKITDEQAERSHRRALDAGQRIGEALVEMGFLKRRELLPAVRLQLEEIVYSLFAWDQGEYTIVPGEPAVERIRLTTHPAAMVLEGVRRKYSRDLLLELVGPPESALEILDPAQRDTLTGVAELAPAERDVVLAFDGVRTLAEVAEQCRLGRHVVYQLAYGLIAFGAARVRRPGEAAPAGAAEDAGAWSEDGPEGAGDGEADLGIDRKRILARHALVDEADYFAVLGVRRDATGFEIQRAYEAACRDYAPAAVPPALVDELVRELAEIREVLDEAYQVLRDDGLRSSYLMHLRD